MYDNYGYNTDSELNCRDQLRGDAQATLRALRPERQARGVARHARDRAARLRWHALPPAERRVVEVAVALYKGIIYWSAA